MGTRDHAYCGLFGALALALPALFHVFGLAGPLFLPMYWPLVALAFLVRPGAAVVTAALVPLVSSFLTGMPLLWPPLAAVLSLELAVQVGLLAVLRKRPRLALAAVLPLGRALHAGLVWMLALKFPNLPAAGISFLSFAAGWPGVLLMMAFVPVFADAATKRDGVCEVRFLKALRRLHVSEGVVLACAQLLRWFEALSRDAEILARALELRRAAARQTSPEPFGGDVVVACRNLVVQYPLSSEPALRLPEFVLKKGERVALLGPNGAGKTTLLSVLAGLQPFDGEVSVFERKPQGASLPTIRARLGFLFENPDDQFLYPTVREDVGYVPGRRGLPPAEGARRVDAVLASLGLPAGNRPIASLSRGQRQRVALAGLLAASPELLLLDEPTAALDDYEKTRLANVLNANGAAMVIATHDRAFAARVCTRMLELGKPEKAKDAEGDWNRVSGGRPDDAGGGTDAVSDARHLGRAVQDSGA
ncbi:MAG: energy-coupling factor ABC transporter ATP-binding protein [Kiritimatiellia bacterium]